MFSVLWLVVFVVSFSSCMCMWCVCLWCWACVWTGKDHVRRWRTGMMSCVLLCSLTLSYSLEGKSLTEPRTRSTVSNCQRLSKLVSALQYCNSTWVTGLYRPALLAFFFSLFGCFWCWEYELGPPCSEPQQAVLPTESLPKSSLIS